MRTWCDLDQMTSLKITKMEHGVVVIFGDLHYFIQVGWTCTSRSILHCFITRRSSILHCFIQVGWTCTSTCLIALLPDSGSFSRTISRSTEPMMRRVDNIFRSCRFCSYDVVDGGSVILNNTVLKNK